MGDIIAKEITHAEYMKMLNTVKNCTEWSKKLRDGIGGGFIYYEKAGISKAFLQEMREAARTEGTQKHIDVLNEVFGEEEPTHKFKVGDWVRVVKDLVHLEKGSIQKITEVEINKPLNITYYRVDGSFCSEEYIEPWIPEVGDWVVFEGKTLQVTKVFNHPGWHSVDAENTITKDCIASYPTGSLRPATKEEVGKAKGEGDLFFTEEGLAAFADVIKATKFLSYDNYQKIPGVKSNGKAQWINKTITKALKDEGLW